MNSTAASLWNLLVTITLNKLRRKARPRREIPVSPDKISPELVAHEPAEEEAVALADEIRVLLEGLGPRYGEMLRLRLEGYSSSEIGEQMGCTRWTVRRGPDRIGERLRRRHREDFDK